MSAPIFSCRDVALDLGGRSILRDISLGLGPGEVLGVIGPNGAGKTSLFEVLSGRIPPKHGSIFYRGENITALPLHRRARLGIGRTFQTPVVPEEMTVAEILKAARQAYKPYLTPVRFRVGGGAGRPAGAGIDDRRATGHAGSAQASADLPSDAKAARSC